ncbi:MAG: M20 family peptidase [Sphaerobacteraceae bacterium]|nr:MAG: M20 family peptidase [Sphaerobacteraceae bacterium]
MNEQEQKAFDLVEASEAKLLERYKTVIGVDTSVPPGDTYEELIDKLEPEFQRLGFKTERVTIPESEYAHIPLPLKGPRTNLVATRSTGKEPITIYAHMDVVPVEEAWTEEPFGAEVKDGKIYGRGTADMKGAIASVLTAVECMDEAGVEPNFDLIVCLCTDEEIGGYPGIEYLAKKGYVKGHMLCLEGGQDPMTWLGSAGSVDVTITVTGESCHSGMNYLGINAIDAMIPVLNELYELKKEVEVRESDLPGPPHPKARSSKMTPMFNFAIINGGVKSNIVPATATLLINRRFIPEETYEQVTQEIQDAVDRAKEKSPARAIDVSFYDVYPAMKLDPNGPRMAKMKESVQLVQGYSDEEWKAFAVAGSTDMANVQQVMGWTDIPFRGPGRMTSRAHGSDEHVYVEDAKAHVKELIHYLAF